MTSVGRSNMRAGLLFILPYGVVWLVFLFGPLLFGFFISLHDWNPLQGNEFIGLSNYLTLFTQARFWNSLIVTWRFILYVIPGIIFVALFGALILQFNRFRGSNIFEALFFFPYLLNVSIVSIIWALMNDPDIGILNILFDRIGLDLPPLLTSKVWALIVIACATIWWLSGYRMIVFRAALASIPQELYDAAKIDGSGAVRTFRSITLPLMKPTLLFTLVLTTVGGMRAFGQVMLMTSGGPGVSSEVLALYMYRLGFDFLEFGRAAAVGFIIFIIIFTLSMMFVRIFRLDGSLR